MRAEALLPEAPRALGAQEDGADLETGAADVEAIPVGPFSDSTIDVSADGHDEVGKFS